MNLDNNLPLWVLINSIRPGDIGLTSNPQGIGKWINFAQGLDEGDSSTFGHVLGFVKTDPNKFYSDGTIYESNVRIGKHNIKNYIGKKILVIRHKHITPKLYEKGIKEIMDNDGMIYPFHRLLFHGLDMFRCYLWRKLLGRPTKRRTLFTKIHLDWPVCSEYWGQFIKAAGLEGGWVIGEKWAGLNPDHFHDVLYSRPDLWEVVCYGNLS